VGKLKIAVDYKYAERSISNGSKSFYYASKFMKQERRNAFYAIYAFCRHTDDLVDDNEGKPRLQRLLIRNWRRRLLEAYRTGETDDPVLGPFVHVMKRYRIPMRYPLELIRGCSMDISKKEYGTFTELRRYCFRVASVVGLMLMRTLGIKNARRSKRCAISLGIAMQLTNILRDVGEDARMGRVYFPKDELARFGLTIGDILAHRKTEGLLRFLKFQVERARRYYHEAMSCIATIHREVRMVIALASTLYREILSVIEENGYEVYAKRAYVNTARKTILYARLVLFGYPRAIPAGG
jgi:15-cis-phytoene synthase